ncbi:MAG: hypothetical protein KF795_12785 [Labilithrix sp.]|nr:hypothetical protein [Labilithrix sp.]
MRFQLFAGGVVSLGLVLAVAACGSSDADPGAGAADQDAGSSGSSGNTPPGSGDDDDDDDTTKDGGSSGAPTLKSDSLVQGEVILAGIAGDDVIYLELAQAGASLHAVPLAGGAPTKIVDLGDDDDYLVNGGAVGIWTGVTGDLGTLNVWTRATLLKENVATASIVGGLFRASPDGSRIAFTQTVTTTMQGAPTSAQVGVRDTSAATNAVTLSGTAVNTGTAMNLAATACVPRMSFAGKVFFATFCAGTAADATNAKLVTVADGASAIVRLDAANNAAPTLKPVFVADSTGTKLFTIATANSAGVLVNVNPVSRTAIEDNVADGVMLPDGSAVVYRTTGNALKKLATAASSTPSAVAADVKGLLRASADNKKVLFNKLDRQQNNPLIDINAVDHSAATPTPVALIPTAAAVPVGFSGDSTLVFFIGDISQTGAKLKSMPAAGGAAKVLTDTVGASPVSSGTGAVFASNPKQIGQAPNQFTVLEVGHVDAATGKVSKIADSIPEGEFLTKDKRLVYSRFAQQGSGLYAVTLP